MCLVEVEVDRETSLALRHQIVYNVGVHLIPVKAKANDARELKANCLSVEGSEMEASRCIVPVGGREDHVI